LKRFAAPLCVFNLGMGFPASFAAKAAFHQCTTKRAVLWLTERGIDHQRLAGHHAYKSRANIKLIRKWALSPIEMIERLSGSWMQFEHIDRQW
jgi:hypothetical protein